MIQIQHMAAIVKKPPAEPIIGSIDWEDTPDIEWEDTPDIEWEDV